MSDPENTTFPTGKDFQREIAPVCTPGFPPARATTRMAVVALGALSLAFIACSKAPDSTAALKHQEEAAPTAESILAKAATKGDLAQVRSLIDEGADVNVTDALGRTPLHMTAFYGRPKTAALLIASGANVNAKDRVGMTPLHAAVLAGGAQEVELLLDKKADINAQSEIGLTPLHLAAATGQLPLTALLIQRAANPQIKDREGNTPLFHATRNNHPKTMALLQQSAGKQ